MKVVSTLIDTPYGLQIISRLLTIANMMQVMLHCIIWGITRKCLDHLDAVSPLRTSDQSAVEYMDQESTERWPTT